MQTSLVRKKSAGLLLLLLLLNTTAECIAATDADNSSADTDGSKEKTEKPLRIVPLITSTPLAGTGYGAAASYLYKTDANPDSSASQLQVGGQYSNTDSITTFIRNNAFFAGNSWISNSVILWSDINSEFDDSDQGRVEYAIKSFSLRQKFLFLVQDNIYLGGQAVYNDVSFSPNNAAGEDFINDNGLTDESDIGVGVSGSYDTRKNKYYPSDAYWTDIDAEAFPGSFGATNSYYLLTVNSRYYLRGLKKGDVWASQLFGKYASDESPDYALPTLSGKSLLRGFPAGQFKARYLSGAQTEYRYQIDNQPFRLIAFGGIAELQGGSFGEGDRARDDDGTYWAIGVGARYAIQSKTGVDLRLDVARTNEEENSLYLALNQSF